RTIAGTPAIGYRVDGLRLRVPGHPVADLAACPAQTASGQPRVRARRQFGCRNPARARQGGNSHAAPVWLETGLGRTPTSGQRRFESVFGSEMVSTGDLSRDVRTGDFRAARFHAGKFEPVSDGAG